MISRNPVSQPKRDRLFAPRKETGSETGFLKETRFLG